MEISVSQEKGRVPVTVLHVRGDIAADSAMQLQDQARAAYEAGSRDLLLDLKDVPFISSSGLRAIHSIFTMLRDESAADSDQVVREGVKAGTYKSPHLKLLKPKEQVLQAMRLAGFDMFLEIHNDLRQAIKSF